MTGGPVIVDSGGANISSLRFALGRLGCSAPLTADAGRIRGASHVFLPGVGAADEAMTRLERSGLADLVRGLRQPVLGICLGMQLLFEASDEDGGRACLGLIPGCVRRIPGGPDRPVPHMGWNLTSLAPDGALFAGLPGAAHFYYVHSYAAPPGEHTVAVADYGGEFTAVVSCGNFHGAQFHPERSGPAGARVLANFLAL
ncbi:MAG TPA: imidazole glycerol phosphate synthase subunit HisH [Gammaproteobacteria bacterium]|nr:imidazole glycerol phosphate synthase subunit HisH [Gammaproteobacteria bacterium]